MSSKDTVDITRRIEAMAAQEDATRCYNYFKGSVSCNAEVNEECRVAMATWCRQVGSKLRLSPDTVWIAMSLCDRYVSSGRGRSQEVLGDRYKFQLGE